MQLTQIMISSLKVVLQCCVEVGVITREDLCAHLEFFLYPLVEEDDDFAFCLNRPITRSQMVDWVRDRRWYELALKCGVLHMDKIVDNVDLGVFLVTSSLSLLSSYSTFGN